MPFLRFPDASMRRLLSVTCGLFLMLPAAVHAGYRVEIDENAPDIASGAYPVLFGNFLRGYYIVRRTGRMLLRDPYTSKPYINFYTTERVGGDVVNSECIKLLKVKAA